MKTFAKNALAIVSLLSTALSGQAIAQVDNQFSLEDSRHNACTIHNCVAHPFNIADEVQISELAKETVIQLKRDGEKTAADEVLNAIVIAGNIDGHLPRELRGFIERQTGEDIYSTACENSGEYPALITYLVELYEGEGLASEAIQDIANSEFIEQMRDPNSDRFKYLANKCENYQSAVADIESQKENTEESNLDRLREKGKRGLSGWDFFLWIFGL